MGVTMTMTAQFVLASLKRLWTSSVRPLMPMDSPVWERISHVYEIRIRDRTSSSGDNRWCHSGRYHESTRTMTIHNSKKLAGHNLQHTGFQQSLTRSRLSQLVIWLFGRVCVRLLRPFLLSFFSFSLFGAHFCQLFFYKHSNTQTIRQSNNQTITYTLCFFTQELLYGN